MARAIASGEIPILSMLSRIWPFISGLVMDSVKFVFTKPGEMIVTAQLVARLLAQALGDRARGKLRAGINRHVWVNHNAGRRGGVDEMSETLLPKHRQRRGDAVENTFDVDVDHVFPILHPQVVQRGDRSNAGVVDENVKL